MARSAEQVAQELANLSTTPRIIYAEVLAIVQRDRREQTQAVVPFVGLALELAVGQCHSRVIDDTPMQTVIQAAEAWLKSVEGAEHDAG